MGKLFRGPNWHIEVRGREHPAPHFHVVGADFDAVLDIRTLAVIEGSLARSARRTALEWAMANRDLLIAEWNRLNPDIPYHS